MSESDSNEMNAYLHHQLTALRTYFFAWLKCTRTEKVNRSTLERGSQLKFKSMDFMNRLLGEMHLSQSEVVNNLNSPEVAEFVVENKAEHCSDQNISSVELTANKKNPNSCCDHRKSSFLIKMEALKERREYNIKKSQERRERIQCEKLKIMQAEAAKIAQEIEVEKRQRKLEIMEKRRLKEEERLRIETLRIRQRALNLLAKEKREHFLLKFHGFLPWVNYTELKKRWLQSACEYYVRRLLRSHLLAWLEFTRVQTGTKLAIAEQFCNRRMYTGLFCILKKMTYERKNQFNLAVNHFERFLLRKALCDWIETYRCRKKDELQKSEKARQLNELLLKQRTILAFANYVPISRRDKVRAERISKYQKIILNVIPDFRPSNDYEY